MGISVAVARIFELITLLLLISVFLTWVPNLDWGKPPFCHLRAFSEMFFAPFRKIIPPIGMIDISPIAAFFLLSILGKIIVSFLQNLGL